MCMLCFVLINSVILNHLCVWILLQLLLSSVSVTVFIRATLIVANIQASGTGATVGDCSFHGLAADRPVLNCPKTWAGRCNTAEHLTLRCASPFHGFSDMKMLAVLSLSYKYRHFHSVSCFC